MTTLDKEFDWERLKTQQERVEGLMRGGEHRTLRHIANVVGCSEAAISARLRDARKNGFTVHKRRIGDPKKGLWEYWFDTSLIATASKVMANIVGWNDPT